MRKNEVQERIASLAGEKVSDLNEETLLIDLVPESFRLVELVIELQEEFGVRLLQEELKNVRTVADLADLVNKKRT